MARYFANLGIRHFCNNNMIAFPAMNRLSMRKLAGSFFILFLGLSIYGCGGAPVVPLATINVEAKGAFEKKLASVERIALSLGFESFDPAPINARYFPEGDIVYIQAYRLPSRPNLELKVSYFPFGKGPYGGNERWFDVVMVDTNVDGVKFEGVAREKLINLVEMLRKEFGREFIRMIAHRGLPKIE